MRGRFLAVATMLAALPGGVAAGAPAALAAQPRALSASAARAGAPAASTPSSTAAGYYLSGADGAFTSVSAHWTAPTAHCVAGTQYVSFWVGLDGESSSSVEQIGMDADCSSGTPSYFGWYDMYPSYPVDFSNVIKPGDAMSASVSFTAPNAYTLVLRDATQGWTQTVTKSASGLDRSSAEVLTSGPVASGSGSAVLTDFGTLTYTGCEVNGTSLGTQSPVKLTMVDGAGQTMVSTSAITKAGKFTNTWLRGN